MDMKTVNASYAGGMLARARAIGDVEAEQAAKEMLAEIRIRSLIAKERDNITTDAVKRLNACLKEAAAGVV